MNRDHKSARDLFIRGSSLMSSGDLTAATASFREAVRLDPEFAEAHANLGILLDEGGLSAEAEYHYLYAVTLNPDLGKAHMNLGVLLANQKRFEKAEASYRRALDLIPDSPAAWSNFGALKACLKQEKEAEASYRKALALDPDYRLAGFNLSYLLLRQGRFEEGWQCLEARDWYAGLEKNLPFPRWKGESLKGRSMLIGLEAGYGDMIQFCRYASVLKEQGASRVDLICHPTLKTLFASMDGVDAVFSGQEDIPSPGWDYWTPPLSIPYYCGTRLDSIPARIPYLHPDRELTARWSTEMSRECPSSDVRVGLVWKGNPRFENDADRSLQDLGMLESLGSIPRVRFFSLQKGPGEEEAAAPPAGLPLVNLGPRITDFADSAAAIENLDLVICVDTAVAHLAGALARRCWLLLPDFKTDWRWMTGRNDSPWYPGVMRLFRQPGTADWEPVVAEVRAALIELVTADRTSW